MPQGTVLPLHLSYLVSLSTLSRFPVLVEFPHLDSLPVDVSPEGYDAELGSMYLLKARTLPDFCAMVNISQRPLKTNSLQLAPHLRFTKSTLI